MKNFPTLLAGFAIILAGTGCGKPPKPHDLIVGVDTSGSTKPYVADYARELRRILPTLAHGSNGSLAIYRYDVTVQELYDAPRPENSEQFQTKIEKELGNSSARGTYPSLVLEKIAWRLQIATRPCTIILFTDGGDDDNRPSANAQARLAASQIKKSKWFRKLLLVGVQPGQREVMRRILSPLGRSLHFVDGSSLYRECR